MADGVSDNRLLRLFKMHMTANDRKLMKTTYLCGSRVVPAGVGRHSLVYVAANKTDSKINGVATCKNPWICPVCEPKVMAKHATDIACAIEALKEWHHQRAAMITFTIPHTSGMDCKTTLWILRKTWEDFIIHGKKRQSHKYYLNRNSENKVLKVGKTKLNDAFSSFCEEFEIRHRVRVAEITHGAHGWHPHYHCLFWTPAKKLQGMKDWQDRLEQRWLELAKRNTIKAGLDPTRVQIMYDRLNDGSKGVYISVDDKGNVIAQESSKYIAGWGGDLELTGNYQHKASNEGHETPRQMLDRGLETGEMDAIELYLEFARAVKLLKMNRVSFSSRSGIRQIIEQWKKTKSYVETLKKNLTAQLAANGRWKVVCWFTQEQWSRIWWLNLEQEIIPKILALARSPYNAFDMIAAFLRRHGIEIEDNYDIVAQEPELARQISFFENEILNSHEACESSEAAS